MILTDDDTAAFGPESCFGGPDDRDAMYDDAPGLGPKCGGCWRNEFGDIEGCSGCRECFPPDAEAIGTGFEIWERPDFYRLRGELSETAKLGYCRLARSTCSITWSV